MSSQPLFIWIIFNLSVVGLLFLDAFVLNPKSKEMTLGRAIAMTGFWVLLALLFNLLIYYWLGSERALEFLTSYVVEQSLSIDNLFVFLLIFSYFKTSRVDQRRMLFWGIISAQVMRAVFIIFGVYLLHVFSWTTYVFGAILFFTGIKLFFKHDDEIHPESNPFFKFISKRLSLFWVVFITIQVTDLVFAIDSIPAVLAITKHSFIAYSSNIFAILGLRSMYFALESFMKVFHYLHYGLAVILSFVGIKMLLEHVWHPHVLITLGFILITLILTVVASIVWPPRPSIKSS